MGLVFQKQKTQTIKQARTSHRCKTARSSIQHGMLEGRTCWWQQLARSRTERHTWYEAQAGYWNTHPSKPMKGATANILLRVSRRVSLSRTVHGRFLRLAMRLARLWYSRAETPPSKRSHQGGARPSKPTRFRETVFAKLPSVRVPVPS